ncbi:hypothetical protein KFK09_006623 [Dendrobium nobile]|uniref:Uncharacterized protein n=1 Tax=Dendrobium nobile TaxID=94219 RepID=A0A8T3BU57_DENNO|nr:hypothetical protein KFK09_006623 [Dendrobium nobile]
MEFSPTSRPSHIFTLIIAKNGSIQDNASTRRDNHREERGDFAINLGKILNSIMIPHPSPQSWQNPERWVIHPIIKMHQHQAFISLCGVGYMNIFSLFVLLRVKFLFRSNKNVI